MFALPVQMNVQQMPFQKSKKGLIFRLLLIFILIINSLLKAIEGGADKIRINPGNIGNREKVEAVVKAAKEKGIPIRIGVNAGSLEKRIIDKYGYPTADGMVESALHHIKILEDLRLS